MNTFKVLQELAALKQNEKKSTPQLHQLQHEQLRTMLTYAYEYSPYYKSAFEAAGLTAETVRTAPLSAFPVLDKAALLSRFDQLITVSDVTQEELRCFDAGEQVDRKPYKGKHHVVHSSGSTGTPGYFLYDSYAWNRMLLGIIRGALWDMSMPQILKLLAQGPRIAYIAATDGRYGGAMAVGDGIDGVGAKQMYLDIKTPLAEWVSKLRAFRPNIIIGYPSAIKILAELIDSGEVSLRVVRVISCGEPLSGRLRGFLEGVFHTHIVNFYGSSESLAMGVETDPAEGMLLFDDMNVIEVAEDGIYLTCLYNFAQPLIRYRLSDRLVLQPPKADSQYPFTRATGLLGRSEDLLWFEDSAGNREFLHPMAIEGFCIEGLLDYQFRQTGKSSFEMLAETAENANQEVIQSEMLRQMRTILLEKGLDHVEFSVRFVEQILPDFQTGKKKLVISKYTDGMRQQERSSATGQSTPQGVSQSGASTAILDHCKGYDQRTQPAVG